MRTPWGLLVRVGGDVHRALFDRRCPHPEVTSMSRPPSCTTCGDSVPPRLIDVIETDPDRIAAFKRQFPTAREYPIPEQTP